MGDKILIGMSGGVDSSTAALLLQQKGHQVCGCTLKLYSNEDIGLCSSRTCCSLQDVEDARSVACRLGMDHLVFNFGDIFRQTVIEPFAESYVRGETPNPCIECNRTIKFGKMLDRARLLGMTHIATGHYVRSEFDESRGRWILRKAVDSSKDQSYVLYVMTQDELAHTHFPLGGMTKQKVRALAEEHGLVNARKPDSQDICFVPDGDYAGFLTHVMGIKSQEGNFIDRNGKVLGRHKGIIHYTIGQRRGLNISLGKRTFVVSKDTQTNTVVLGDDTDLYVSFCLVRDLNWIAIEELTAPMHVLAKVRYSQREVPATISTSPNGRVLVEFDQPQRAPAPGQAAVFYDGDVVLGGGTITAQ